MKVKSPKDQISLAKQCMGEKLTIRSLGQKLPSKSAPYPSWVGLSLSELEKKYGLRIHLNYKKGKGKLSFPFGSEKELKTLMDRLWPKT